MVGEWDGGGRYCGVRDGGEVIAGTDKWGGDGGYDRRFFL